MEYDYAAVTRKFMGTLFVATDPDKTKGMYYCYDSGCQRNHAKLYVYDFIKRAETTVGVPFQIDAGDYDKWTGKVIVPLYYPISAGFYLMKNRWIGLARKLTRGFAVGVNKDSWKVWSPDGTDVARASLSSIFDYEGFFNTTIDPHESLRKGYGPLSKEIFIKFDGNVVFLEENIGLYTQGEFLLTSPKMVEAFKKWFPECQIRYFEPYTE